MPPTDIDIVSIGDHVALTSGPVIAAIDLSEGAGLVVMGLRGLKHGRPGEVASAVLHAGKTFVLAVPGR